MNNKHIIIFLLVVIGILLFSVIYSLFIVDMEPEIKDITILEKNGRFKFDCIIKSKNLKNFPCDDANLTFYQNGKIIGSDKFHKAYGDPVPQNIKFNLKKCDMINIKIAYKGKLVYNHNITEFKYDDDPNYNQWGSNTVLFYDDF